MNDKEYSKSIMLKFDKIKRIKKIAEKVTLLEFIERYEKSYCDLTLGSFWHSVNDDVDYYTASYEGTDPN
tara:strand:- start:39 stop:248 length:210 start_codon:yes stop_codon:yes gene_type:complete